MTPKHDDAFDVFLSFAGPDEARAAQLASELQNRGCQLYFSPESKQAGSRWRNEIPDALRASRVVVVLLSENSAEARYQGDEIDLAIERQKAGDLEILPVYRDRMPKEQANWQFGLKGYNSLEIGTAPMDRVADLVAERLDGLLTPTVSSGDDSAEALHTFGEYFHHAALKIDRTRQWVPILEICGTRQNALFLVHGPRQQNLDSFVARIWHYLATECNHHHRSYVVPLQVEFAIPRTAAAWENHLRLGLTRGGDRGGTAEDLLRDAARTHPVFLVLSRLPIASGGADDFGGLDEAEIAALEDFLQERLPRLLVNASAGAHPIRALLATHYSSEDDSLVERLDDAAYTGSRTHSLPYFKLPALRPLDWSDVENFLDNRPKRPPKHVVRKLKAAFDKLERDDMEFRDIIDLLGKVLH